MVLSTFLGEVSVLGGEMIRGEEKHILSCRRADMYNIEGKAISKARWEDRGF